jgi:fructose/tagatose bisphosphate aldolase
LQQILSEADQQKVAVGNFNISDLVALKVVFLPAREVSVPVLVGLMPGSEYLTLYSRLIARDDTRRTRRIIFG